MVNNCEDLSTFDHYWLFSVPEKKIGSPETVSVVLILLPFYMQTCFMHICSLSSIQAAWGFKTLDGHFKELPHMLNLINTSVCVSTLATMSK